MTDLLTPALRPDLFGQLAATDPYQARARRLFERGQVTAVSGNQADVLVGYAANGDPLELKAVPIISGYVPHPGDWVAIQYEAGHASAPWVTGPSMAADDQQDPAGIGVFSVSSAEPDDPPQSLIYFDSAQQTWRGWDGSSWVDFGSRLHNNLPDLQGGAPGEYYHLTASQYAALPGGGSFPPTAVIYADEEGHLEGDATSFAWTGSQLLLNGGSAAAPALARVGFPDDGIYWPGDGVLGWALGGAERMRLSNVGLSVLKGSAAAYPLDVLGQGYFSEQLGVGVAPDSTRAINASITAGSDVQHISIYSLAMVPIAFSNTAIGYLGDARATSSNNLTNATAGLIGLEGAARIVGTSITPTVTSAIGVRGSITSSGAGVGGSFTTAYGVAVRTSLGASTTIGTLYGFYMPACSGALRWGVYIADTGAPSYFASDVVVPATVKLRLDGSTSGDSYLYERAGNIISHYVGGNDQFEVRSNHQYARSVDYSLAADGEWGVMATRRALSWRVGDVTHLAHGQIGVKLSTTDHSGTAAETTICTETIPANSWAQGKTWHFWASGTSDFPGAAGTAKSSRVRIKIAGNVIVTGIVMSVAGTDPAGTSEWIVHGTFTCRSRASSGTTVAGGGHLYGETSIGGGSPTEEVGANTWAINTTAAQTLTLTVEHNLNLATMHTYVQQWIVWEA